MREYHPRTMPETKKPKSLVMPVIMYPEGVNVGRVRTARDARTGRVRHVAFTANGTRVGTFDTFADAKAAVIGEARKQA